MINKLKLYIIMICRLELGLQNNLELKNIKNIKKNQNQKQCIKISYFDIIYILLINKLIFIIIYLNFLYLINNLIKKRRKKY